MSFDSKNLLRILIVALLVVSCEGPTGPQGTAGTPGVSNLQIVSVEGVIQPVQPGSPNATGNLSLRADCPADKKVISGGYAATSDGSQFVSAWQSFPSLANAWTVALHNGYVSTVNVTVFAVCATTQ